MEELQAEATYHRERYQLYKAKTLGPHLTSAVRLRELERVVRERTRACGRRSARTRSRRASRQSRKTER